ncbi:hypothetical protein AGLY_013737 [Aphis glycines]|uniref:Uncharacterized protein n=1 Tax=Aphis glycines TaxID=307491 RepID=A0A6G0T5K4_APHGL|nr:hypothetical protein AGLY_013737 [Aphis glycines]
MSSDPDNSAAHRLKSISNTSAVLSRTECRSAAFNLYLNGGNILMASGDIDESNLVFGDILKDLQVRKLLDRTTIFQVLTKQILKLYIYSVVTPLLPVKRNTSPVCRCTSPVPYTYLKQDQLGKICKYMNKGFNKGFSSQGGLIKSTEMFHLESLKQINYSIYHFISVYRKKSSSYTFSNKFIYTLMCVFIFKHKSYSYLKMLFMFLFWRYIFLRSKALAYSFKLKIQSFQRQSVFITQHFKIISKWKLSLNFKHKTVADILVNQTCVSTANLFTILRLKLHNNMYVYTSNIFPHSIIHLFQIKTRMRYSNTAL